MLRLSRSIRLIRICNNNNKRRSAYWLLGQNITRIRNSTTRTTQGKLTTENNRAERNRGGDDGGGLGQLGGRRRRRGTGPARPGRLVICCGWTSSELRRCKSRVGRGKTGARGPRGPSAAPWVRSRAGAPASRRTSRALRCCVVGISGDGRASL